MIIELKDIPSYPIRKLDIHIEFSETGAVTASVVPAPKQSLPNKPDSTPNETPDIPQEMLNADF